MKDFITFSPYTLKNLKLKNRIVMPPMCMYSAKNDGKVTDFHITHYTARALGGLGLIIVEATGVMPNGRISDFDLGIWDDSHIEGLKNIVSQMKAYGAYTGIQINHGGRKYEGEFPLVGPSPIAYDETMKEPSELSAEEIKEIISAFGQAARRANEAGFDMLEIHGAHGYLINQFLSPRSNKRSDTYGGSLENRVRFLKEVIRAIKKYWPEEKVLCIRISATEHQEDGYTEKDMVNILNLIKDDIDIVHVSTGGNGPWNIRAYPGYQVVQSEILRNEVGLPTIAVGLIEDAKHVEAILSNKRADLVAIGRELLINPFLVLQEEIKYSSTPSIPKQYLRGVKK